MTELREYLRYGFAFRAAAAVLLAALCLSACDISAALPIPAATPTPCSRNCPPPVRTGGDVAHTATTSDFSLLYFAPWSVQARSPASVTLVAATDFGELTVVVSSQEVNLGTASSALLAEAEQRTLDPSQYTNIVDTGVIRGAEIGYVDGSGESFQAASLEPNAPDLPLYVQIMASVRGSTGLTFVAISPVEPNSPSGHLTPDAEYDHIVNSIVWL